MEDEILNSIPNKELDKEILIPIPRESKLGKDCDFPLGDDFQSFKTFSNPLFEKQDDFPSRNDESIFKEEVHKETLKSHLNPLFKDDEEIISNEVSRQISPKVDVKTIVSFFSPIGNCVRKWATSEFVKDNDEFNHEVFKSDNENDLGIHDNEEEEIVFLDGLLEDENFFEINDKKVEFLERKAKEDSETKVEPEKKKELQVFHPDIEILNHFETNSYVGSDYVFYEDFSLVDIIFPVNIQGKVFDPGISHFEKDAFKDKSSKELAPSKALLTLDVFDPLHPPLMDFHVTKAFSGFTFSLLKIFSKKFFEPGIKNATFGERVKRRGLYNKQALRGRHPMLILLFSFYFLFASPRTNQFGGEYSLFSGFWKIHGSILWKDKAIPTISIDGLQSSLHKERIKRTKRSKISQKPTKKRKSQVKSEDGKPMIKAKDQ
ncbi:hypothetical protein Tco_1017441 [Tanacetum coccineum]|uniref:Uncharacterized protein n=1 Tax=Tanacetum coccineum TaxID=301880 RepID=A0ABQ5FRH4_9ASTR